MVLTIKVPVWLENIFKWIGVASVKVFNWVVGTVKVIAKFVKYVFAFKA
jgi:hypothetical protein